MSAWWQSLGRAGRILIPAAVVFVILVIIAAASPSSKTTTVTSPPAAAVTVTSPAPPSVRCGSGTHLTGGVCQASAPRIRTVTVTTPAPASTSSTPAAAPGAPVSSAPSSAIETVGSSDHSTDTQFCSVNQCIGDFTGEGGTIVQCADGTYSHAGGISGACSHHGGEQ